MKTAIYVEDGITQVVLTPESEWEQDIIKRFGDKEANVKIMRGSFYNCAGGWARVKFYYEKSPYEPYPSDSSLILRVEEVK